jgi:hypothetical protein
MPIGVPGSFGVEGEELQPAIQIKLPAAIRRVGRMRGNCFLDRRTRGEKNSPRTTAQSAIGPEDKSGRSSIARAAVVVTVRVLLAALPEPVSVAGENVHVVSAGRLPQESFTVPL